MFNDPGKTKRLREPERYGLVAEDIINLEPELRFEPTSESRPDTSADSLAFRKLSVELRDCCVARDFKRGCSSAVLGSYDRRPSFISSRRG